jgi:hypothetical protein
MVLVGWRSSRRRASPAASWAPTSGGSGWQEAAQALGLQFLLAAWLMAAAAVMAVAGVETRGRTLEQIDGHQASPDQQAVC